MKTWSELPAEVGGQLAANQRNEAAFVHFYGVRR
jgi:hypothetical protein